MSVLIKMQALQLYIPGKTERSEAQDPNDIFLKRRKIYYLDFFFKKKHSTLFFIFKKKFIQSFFFRGSCYLIHATGKLGKRSASVKNGVAERKEKSY